MQLAFFVMYTGLMMDEPLKNKYRSNDGSNHRKQFSDIIKSLLDVYSLRYTIDFFLSLLHFTPLSSPKPQPQCCLACQPTALTSSHELLTCRSPLIGWAAINNSLEVLAERRREGERARCCCWELGPTGWEQVGTWDVPAGPSQTIAVRLTARRMRCSWKRPAQKNERSS